MTWANIQTWHQTRLLEHHNWRELEQAREQVESSSMGNAHNHITNITCTYKTLNL